MSKEIKPGQNRFISVTCCAECPLNGTCSAWSKLDSKQKTFLNLSNSVPVDMMLTECPLKQMPKESTELEKLRKELKIEKKKVEVCEFTFESVLALKGNQGMQMKKYINSSVDVLAKLNQQGE